MILSMSDQALLFLTTVIIGAFIGFIYDFIRIFRKVIRHPDFVVQIEDSAFWILSAAGIFIIMLDRNYGEIRLFSILGIFIGMIIYFFTVSRPFLSVSFAIIDFIKRVIKFIIYVVLLPFKFILKLLSYPYRFVEGYILFVYRKLKSILKKYYLCVKIKRDTVLSKLSGVHKNGNKKRTKRGNKKRKKRN